jgi:phenylacetic acid degradation operon negative regulatory protein
VRSAISRLKKKGVLVSQQAASGKGYALAAELEPHMQAGDERIFSSPSMNIRDPWLLVSFSVPESERQHRHKIRTGLARMGFGTVNAGLYIGPARLQAEAVEYIREHQLWPYIELFTCEPSGLSDIQEKISRWWNWDKLANEYQSFLNSYQHEVEVWQTALRQGTGEPLEAFRLYMPMVTRWRRLPFLDPGLAPELLPDNWVGNTARKLFGDLHRLLSPLSSQHVQQAIPNWKARGTE